MSILEYRQKTPEIIANKGAMCGIILQNNEQIKNPSIAKNVINDSMLKWRQYLKNFIIDSIIETINKVKHGKPQISASCKNAECGLA